jgi:hypothetical protein
MANAKSKLESHFDVALSSLGGRKNSMKSLTLADAVEREKAAWTENGTLPWSSPMRPSLKSYIQSIEKAREDLKRALLKAGQTAASAHDERALALLEAEKTDAPEPIVVATWRCTGKHNGTLTFYSDGRLDSGRLNELGGMSLGRTSGSSRTSRRSSSKSLSNRSQNAGRWSFRGEEQLNVKVANQSRSGYDDERCTVLQDGTKFFFDHLGKKIDTATRVDQANGRGSEKGE